MAPYPLSEPQVSVLQVLRDGEYGIPHLAADLRMIEREGDVGFDEARLVAAIEALAFEAIAVEPAAPAHLRHRVCQLDLAARAGALLVEMREHVRLQDVASDDGERRRRIFRFWLLDQP